MLTALKDFDGFSRLAKEIEMNDVVPLFCLRTATWTAETLLSGVVILNNNLATAVLAIHSRQLTGRQDSLFEPRERQEWRSLSRYNTIKRL